MVQTQREIMYLPPKDRLATNTTDFARMKQELAKVTAAAKEEEEKDRPSLLAPEKGCPEPEKIDYEPGQPIESLCAGR
jgi:hypothetical protein